MTSPSRRSIGVARYASYLPRLRLERRLIEAAWGTKQPAGDIAVASYDEDALTLAIEAAAGCAGDGGTEIDAAYFASTSAPYREKQMAALMATACDFRRDIFTADFTGSARAGLAGVLAAWRAVQAGAAHDVLVAAAELRVAQPGSELEGVLGDGAAAVTLSDHDVIAEIVDAASVSEEFTYVWRTDRSPTVRAQGGKFSKTYGYGRDLGAAIRKVLERHNSKAADVGRLALYSPDARAAADLAKSLGFDPKKQLVEPLTPAVGCTGCAEPLLLLARALDQAAPGELILVGGYGEGADVILLRTTDRIAEARAAVPLQRWIDAKALLPSYEKYLKYRRILEVDEVADVVTNVLEHQELKQNLRLYGSRCRACGLVQYPMARVCIGCKAREQLDDARLARRGKVFTFTIDMLIPSIEHPLPMAVVDLDGGGRLYLQVADAEEVQVGDDVALTFRRLHEGGGNYNYYWKARPRRER